MATTTTRTATYKGKTYRLAWMGRTKYGERAKLQFFDGSREFWVDASKVQVREDAGARGGYRGGRRSGGCRGCGGPIVNAPHHPAMDGYCGTCAFDEFDF